MSSDGLQPPLTRREQAQGRVVPQGRISPPPTARPRQPRAPWIIAGVVIGGITAVVGIAAAVNNSEVTVTYEVTGGVTGAQVAYLAPGGVQSGESDIPLKAQDGSPLAFTFHHGAAVSVSVTPINPGYGFFTCTIREGDQVISQNSGEVAFCSGRA